MIIPEAFAYGIPVIASNRGGIPEMIQEGINGFLFEPVHQQELTEKMKYFVESPDEIGRMGSLAAESARPFLDVNSWLKKYELLYHEIFSLSKEINL
jgi:glycosyltransferase involved in cell wall biosynthesis